MGNNGFGSVTMVLIISFLAFMIISEEPRPYDSGRTLDQKYYEKQKSEKKQAEYRRELIDATEVEWQLLESEKAELMDNVRSEHDPVIMQMYIDRIDAIDQSQRLLLENARNQL